MTISGNSGAASSSSASSSSNSWEVPRMTLQQLQTQMGQGSKDAYVSPEGVISLGRNHISDVLQLSNFERKVLEGQLRNPAGDKTNSSILSDGLPRLSYLKTKVKSDESGAKEILSNLTVTLSKSPKERYDLFIRTIGKSKSQTLAQWETKALYWLDNEEKFAPFSKIENDKGKGAMELQRELLRLPEATMVGPRIVWTFDGMQTMSSELFALSIRFPEIMHALPCERDLKGVLGEISSGLTNHETKAYLSFFFLQQRHELLQKEYVNDLQVLASALTGLNQIWPEDEIGRNALETVVPTLSLLVGQHLTLIDNMTYSTLSGDTTQETDIAPYERVENLQKVLQGSRKPQVAFYNFLLSKFLPYQRNQLLAANVAMRLLIEAGKPAATPKAQMLLPPAKNKPKAKKRGQAPKKTNTPHQPAKIVKKDIAPVTASITQSPAVSVEKDLSSHASSSTIVGVESSMPVSQAVMPKPISEGSLFDYYRPQLHQRVSRWKSVRPDQKVAFSDYNMQNLDPKHQEKLRFWHGFPWLADHLIRNPLYTQKIENADGSCNSYAIAEIRYANGDIERGYVEWSMSKTSVLYHRFFKRQTDQELLQLAAKRAFQKHAVRFETDSAVEEPIEPVNNKFLFDPVLESYTFVEEETNNSIKFLRIN